MVLSCAYYDCTHKQAAAAAVTDEGCAAIAERVPVVKSSLYMG